MNLLIQRQYASSVLRLQCFQTNGGTNLIDKFWSTQGGHLGMFVSLSRKVVRSSVDVVDRAMQVNSNRCTNGGSIPPLSVL